MVLAFYLPLEPLKVQALRVVRMAATGALTLCAPSLTRYELLNALSRAVRGLKKATAISMPEAGQILEAIALLQMEEHGIAGLERRILAITRDHRCTAYDASYLALAEHLNADFLTADQAFRRNLAHHFPRVRFLGEYRPHPG
ncbi:MAG: type II toxin-antitoxin system VapC family toxin [Armatimonadetes bacterium]|nr:type II toxin-antitoxin system VapC family toxin [Armatimonadota bacterium]